MASPLFHRFFKRFIVQQMHHHSTTWEDCEAFGDRDSAERFARQIVTQNSSIHTCRVFDRITGQAGQEYREK